MLFFTHSAHPTELSSVFAHTSDLQCLQTGYIIEVALELHSYQHVKLRLHCDFS